VFVNGQDNGFNVTTADEEVQTITVPLPDDAASTVTLTFRNPILTLKGPWELALPIANQTD
jgi:hypothetical protein